MKKMLLKKAGAVWLLAFLLSACCNCYLPKSISNAEALRPQLATLIESSKDSIQLHRAEVDAVTKQLDEAIFYNSNARKGCKKIKKMWAILNQDVDSFIAGWEKKPYAASIVMNRKSTVDHMLVNIIEAEGVIMLKKKECTEK